MSMVEWTAANFIQASAEGWSIFEASGSLQNRDGRSPYQLQRNDEAAIFPDDQMVWHWVISQAEQGSEFHLAALQYLSQESPGEIDEIAQTFPSVRDLL